VDDYEQIRLKALETEQSFANDYSKATRNINEIIAYIEKHKYHEKVLLMNICQCLQLVFNLNPVAV
jgi:hypothetical protein